LARARKVRALLWNFAVTDRLLAALPPGPFAQLSALLGGENPGKEPINLSIGDPSGEVPAFVSEALTKAAASFGTYPPIHGTADWREAAAFWLRSRFGLPAAAIDPERHVLPLNGSREGLFLSLFPLMPTAKGGGKPAVAMPNPFYQVYAAAALAAGAEPIYVPAHAANGFLPDYRALPEQVLNRLVAVYLCSPSNPEGASASEAYWRDLFQLADAHDFTVLADECYADIYFGAAPVSSLTARQNQSGGLSRLLSFHSLSKRSGLPGLRSGMVAGDAALMAMLRGLRNVAGPQMPGPILAASAAAWRDEAHVATNRARFKENMDAAASILGPAMRYPSGGFFLWLEVGDGEKAALRLWREEGVKVLPGAYMGRETVPGKAQSNPGFSFIRVALVNQLSTIMAALERVRKIL
jgi:aspartate/methionine/tyrosine aminotransferase